MNKWALDYCDPSSWSCTRVPCMFLSRKQVREGKWTEVNHSLLWAVGGKPRSAARWWRCWGEAPLHRFATAQSKENSRRPALHLNRNRNVVKKIGIEIEEHIYSSHISVEMPEWANADDYKQNKLNTGKTLHPHCKFWKARCCCSMSSFARITSSQPLKVWNIHFEKSASLSLSTNSTYVDVYYPVKSPFFLFWYYV